MRIVVDLQAIQTESRYRGVGRYSLSLARSMIAEGKKHEFVIALNHAFPETLDTVKHDLEDLLPRENFVVFSAPLHASELAPRNIWRRHTSELIREHYVERLRPDWVYLSHIFEGLDSDAVASIGRFSHVPTAATLYDLIPYRYPDRYLVNPAVKDWYRRRLEQLRNADVLLAISEYTRRDAIDGMRLPPERVVNISGDADPQFHPTKMDEHKVRSLRARHGLYRDIVMYTGGIDFRKNIEGLIEAYSLLPSAMRAEHQLAVCCKADEADRRRLLALAETLGLVRGEVVITGYVKDEDLVALYNLCKLFVFPSLSEGFGLPVLEAMRCGAPVIGSATASIPEIIGMDSALFDPTSARAISDKLRQALSDSKFRKMLQDNGAARAAKFSWKTTAKRALDAIEAAHDVRRQTDKGHLGVAGSYKPKLAYLSPLPPQRSGIADYARELLPELRHYYDIELITDFADVDPKLGSFARRRVAEFAREAGRYDRVLYEFGNSEFHTHMFGLLPKYPGTVVLHDFFLSGALNYMEVNDITPAALWVALYRSHGYPGLMYRMENGAGDAIREFPCSLDVLRQARGVIVHSPENVRLAETFFSAGTEGSIVVIPQLYQSPVRTDRQAARCALSLPPDAFLVCTFGSVDQTKLNDRLLDSWIQSSLAKDKRCRLLFVGDGNGSPYEQSLRGKISRFGGDGRIVITGYVDAETYRRYLEAADAAVQLRKDYRGGTARTAIDCLSHGIPTIVNNLGLFAELPDNAVLKLPAEFGAADLTASIETLENDSGRRTELSRAGMNYVKSNLDPAKIALQYAEAIESFYAFHPVSRRQDLLGAIASLDVCHCPADVELAEAAGLIAESIERPRIRQILVDVSAFADRGGKVSRATPGILLETMCEPPAGYRVEPVYHSDGFYRYARDFAGRLIGVGDFGLDDAPVDVVAGDIFVGLDHGIRSEGRKAAGDWLQYHIQRGMKLYPTTMVDLLAALREGNPG